MVIMESESRIPSEQECLELMAEVNLAPAVVNHSIAVKNVALRLADKIEKGGVKVNKPLIAAAALLHDIMKIEAEVCHGIEGGEFLRKRGFHEVASIVEKHCLSNLGSPGLVPRTTEEKLLMYSDLRVKGGNFVSLEERFDYIRERYPLKNPRLLDMAFDFAKQLEQDLFGECSFDNVAGDEDG